MFLLLACSSGSDDTQNTGAGDTSFGPGGLTESTSAGGTAIGGVDGTTTGTVTATSATGNATATSATGISTGTNDAGSTVTGTSGVGGAGGSGTLSSGGPGTDAGGVGGSGSDTSTDTDTDTGTSTGMTGSGGMGGATTGDGGSGNGSGGNSGGSGNSGPDEGEIAINDPVPGFASVPGGSLPEGTVGGGTDLASAVTVSSMSELKSAASGSSPAIILVEPGNYSGALSIGSNKTIIGLAPGAKIIGNLKISGEGTSNVIVRNIAVQGEPCASYDECRAGADAVYVGNGAHHVWLDHMDISDGQDGNCDVTQAGDFVTISWSKFYYTYDKEHRFSNLIAGSDDETNSRGKLNITYMNCEWGSRVDSRQPRGRFGNIHMLNNYHHTGGGQIHGVGVEMALIAEQCVYEESGSIWTDMGSPRGWRGIGNIGSASGLSDSRGTVFEVPYDYTPLPASEVKTAVTSPNCGAGNTCTLHR